MNSVPELDVPRHPHERASRYERDGIWATRPIGEEFHRIALRHGDRLAAVDDQGSISYHDLDVRSDQVAAWLIRQRLGPGATVLFQAANRVETIVAWYGVLKAAAIPVCTLTRHRSNEIGPISAGVRPAAHIIDMGEDLLELARDNAARHPSVQLLLAVGADAADDDVHRVDRIGRDIPESVARLAVQAAERCLAPDDVAVFQLSGGTTAAPKVIPRLHGEYWANAVRESAALQRDENACIAHLLPIVHNAGVIHALFGAHSVGGCAVVLNFAAPERMFGVMAAAGVNELMIGTPILAFLDTPHWLALQKSLRRLVWSGSKLPAEVFARFRDAGIWIGQVWGMAEGPWLMTALDAEEATCRDSVGTPLYGCDEYKLTDLDGGDELRGDETGLLWYRGPSTIAGYVNAQEHNGTALVDGFLDTGDLARVIRYPDGTAAVAIEGRVKDVISRGGEKISTEEVEHLLTRHLDIAEAAVVAVPDPHLGERARAYLVGRAGGSALDLAAVQAHLEGLGVAKYKWPEQLEWVSALPRTNSMKVDKRALRERAAVVAQSRG